MRDRTHLIEDPPTANLTQPFVQLQLGKGLFGVTKFKWRTWPARNWLSWLIAALFLAGAAITIYLTTKLAVHESRWHFVARIGFTCVLAVLVVIRLVLESTVSKPLPGQPPKWDRQLVDPWWTTIHTLSGVALGLWLTPFLISVATTILWELLEICVPGYGDEEVNGNRIIDNLVAWLGWLVAAGLWALVSGQPLPFL